MAQNNIKYIFFDIDQTLLKPNGELQKGCREMIRAVYESKIPFGFVSGKNMKEVRSFVSKLCRMCQIDRNDFKPFLASNAGACMQKFDGEIVQEPLKEQDLKEIENIVSSISQSAVIVYKTNAHNFKPSILDKDGVKNKAKTLITNCLVKAIVEMGKADLPLTTTTKNYIDKIAKEDEILSLEILSANKKNKICDALMQKFPNLVISNCGSAVQISRVGKMKTIESVANDQKVSLGDICFCGDDANDRDCLMSCGFGVLSNPKKKQRKMYDEVVKKQEEGQNKFATNDLGNQDTIKFLTNKPYNKDVLRSLSNDVLKNFKEEKQKASSEKQTEGPKL